MKFDVMGRINNMRLPDGKTAILYSVYEAVSNSIHAINDRFTEAKAATKGTVRVAINTDAEGDIESISVTDNGIGFTPENLDSFETSDSRFKYQRGGKGVGRFIWIKMFEAIMVESIVGKGANTERITFRFEPEKPKSISDKRTSQAAGQDAGSTITLSNLRSEHRGRIRTTSYLKDLALHFFPQYLSGTLPQIFIEQGADQESLNSFIADQVETSVEQTLHVDFGEGAVEVKINHLFVKPAISSNLRNSYLLTAHGRLVGDPISIERKYALKDLTEGKAYVSVVSSPFLDERVDQERLGFKLTGDQRDILERAVMKAAEDFLHEHIQKLRAKQKATVLNLLKEHPQLGTQIENVDEYVDGLSPGMDEEQIGQNLFVLLYRDEKDVKRRIETLDSLASLDQEAREQAELVLSELQNQETHRLAELVVKRHQVLQMANLLLKYKNDDKKSYHYERVVHELVCPMREFFRTGDYSRHNLWMLDESLAGYDFFASDKPISSLTDDSDSSKEPDMIFFNPLGFRRSNTNDPVAIVEFKRPGDDLPSQDPIAQVLGYIDELRDSRVRTVEGEIISDIDKNTPFDCTIVCELTAASRRFFERSIAQHPTPDGDGYYGYSAPHNAYIRVISFQKMLRDAEMRNKAFFHQLKLGSPSLAAKTRAAGARERRKAKNDAILSV